MKRYRTKPGWNRFLGLPIAYEVSAGAAIVRRGVGGVIETLLLRYPHGHWDLPKGHVEAGETLEDTVRREVEEETGLVDIAIIPKFHHRIHYFYCAHGTEREKRIRTRRSLRIVKTVHFFLAEAETVGDVRLSDEHIDAKWFPIDHAERRATFENAKRVLRVAREFFTEKK